MALRDAIHNRLTKDHAGTAALIGRRCYPRVKPQGEVRACVVYSKVSYDRSLVGGSDDGLVSLVYQFNCIAPSVSEMEALVIQVTAALSRWSGTLQSQTIQGTFFVSGAELPDDPSDEGKSGLHAERIDFRIWHAE